MSSWLSGGISNWTDQISTFTKEVIAESTQEIEDPITELQVAKKRIDEVEKQNAQNQEELKRSHKRIKELEDRAETAELQVINNNHEYRKLLQERDDELKQLRKQYSEMQDQQKKLLFSSDTISASHAPPNELSTASNEYLFNTDITSRSGGVIGGGEGAGEYEWLGTSSGDDLDYGFQSHLHVNQLQSEIARLQVECQHWRDLARSKGGNHQLSTQMNEEDVSSSQVQHLQLCLEEERRQHQHELSTLQALHARQLEQAIAQDNNHPADNEVDELHESVQTIRSEEDQMRTKLQESQALVNELSMFLADVRKLFKYFQDTQTSHLEVEKATLVSYLNEVQESFDGHQKAMSELQQQQLSMEEESVQLNRQVSVLQQELKNKENELHSMKHLEESNHELKVRKDSDRVKELGKKLKETELELIEERNERKKVEEKYRETLATHETKFEQAAEEIHKLKNEAMAFEGEIKQKNVQLDSTNTDHVEEVSRLNHKLQQLQGKMEATIKETKELCLANERLRNELINLKSNVDIKEDELRKQNDTMQSLELRLMSQVKENNDLNEELSQTKQLLNSERDAIKRTLSKDQNSIEQQRASELMLQKQLDIVKAENESLRIEKNKLLDNLGSETRRNSLLQTSINAFKSEIEKKDMEIRELQQDKVVETEEVHPPDNISESIRQLAEKNQLLLLENEKNGMEIQRLRTHLSEVNEQHDQEQIQANLNETRLLAQVKMMEEKLRNKEQSDSLLRFKAESEQLSKEKDFIQNEFESLKERHAKDLQSLHNLQAVLEDFQQGRNESQETALALMKARQELKQINEQFVTIQQEKNHLETVMNEMSITCIEAENLKFGLKTAKDEVSKINAELTSYKAAMEKSRLTIESISQDVVDRTLVREMFVTYLSSQDNKKSEIARLIGKVLDVPQDDLNQLIDGGHSGWFSQLWPSSSKPSLQNPQESFSQRFISFLEAESTPTTPVSHPVLVVNTPTTFGHSSSIPAHMQPSIKQQQYVAPSNTSQIIGQLLEEDGSTTN